MATNEKNSRAFEMGYNLSSNIGKNYKKLSNKLKEIDKRAMDIGKLGLIGLTIGTIALLGGPKGERISEKDNSEKGNHVENTIHGVEYRNNQADNNHYKLEGQVLFKSSVKGRENVYFLEKNKKIDEGELDFTMTPQDEALIWASVESSSEKPTLEGTKYISKQITKNGKIVNAIEIKDKRLAAQFKNELKKRTREKSESDFGYSFEINDQDIEKKFPQKTIGDKDYLYVDASRGKLKYFIKDGENLEEKAMSFPETTLPEMFIPLSKETKYSINSKGNPIIYNPQGFFKPVKENKDEQIEEISHEVKTETGQQEIEKETPYMKYRAEMEKRMLGETEEDTNRYYIAQKGDTFWRIAILHRGNGNQKNEIQKLNPDINPDSIKAGQRIRIK